MAPPILRQGKVTLNKHGNNKSYIVVTGENFPDHNACDVKAWNFDADGNRIDWDAKPRPSTTPNRLVVRIRVPRRDHRIIDTETLDITVTNTDDNTDGNTITMDVEIVNENPNDEP